MDDAARRQRDSWAANAAAWVRAVRDGAIASRAAGTDAAILDALAAVEPTRVLDVGCGEGWLCRALAGLGIDAVGVDAQPALVDAARAAGGGRFEVRDYAALASAPADLGRFDAIACNFALLDEDLLPLLRGLRAMAAPGGWLLIQTLHPGAAPETGWRVEAFAGFGDGFTAPMPWFLRDTAAWLELLREGGWQPGPVREPRPPGGGAPLSLLLAARA